MRLVCPVTVWVATAAILALTFISAILSILALSSGAPQGGRGTPVGNTQPPLFKQFAFLSFDTSSAKSALTSGLASEVGDWYDVQYLAICSGMWNGHIASAGKNKSTESCVTQSGGYTFVLLEQMFTELPFSWLLPAVDWNSTYGTIDTQVPLALLSVGFSFTGLSFFWTVYGVIFGSLIRPDLGIRVGSVRVFYVLHILAFVFLASSSAKMTDLTRKVAATGDIGIGVIRARMNKEFFVASWLAAACMLVAFGLTAIMDSILTKRIHNPSNIVTGSIQSAPQKLQERKGSVTEQSKVDPLGSSY